MVALALAGGAYWQAEHCGRTAASSRLETSNGNSLRSNVGAPEGTTPRRLLATKTANSLVYDLAQRFHDTVGSLPHWSKDHFRPGARLLQKQLIQSGQVSPDLKRSEAAALLEVTNSLLAINATRRPRFPPPSRAKPVLADLLARNPESTDYQQELSVAYSRRIGEAQAAQGDLAGR